MGATKETILGTTLTNKILTSETVGEIVKTACTDLDDATDLPTAAAEYVGQAYMIKGVHYRCEDKGSGVYEWETYDTSGQNLNYADASNKPTLNGVTLNGTLTSASVGVASNTSGRTPITDPTSTSILIDDDNSITYENLAAALNTLFDIANLPKYEKQFNPLLIASGGSVMWTITYTLKTITPIIQLFDKNGMLQDSNILTGLQIVSRVAGDITIEFISADNVAANEYYVVLIG